MPVIPHMHSYKDVVTAPTCTEKGYTTHTCACGDSYVDTYTDALGHAWDEGKVTKEATETTQGSMTYTCTRCPGHQARHSACKRPCCHCGIQRCQK